MGKFSRRLKIVYDRSEEAYDEEVKKENGNDF